MAGKEWVNATCWVESISD